jgi:hypothetical protein
MGTFFMVSWYLRLTAIHFWLDFLIGKFNVYVGFFERVVFFENQVNIVDKILQ